MLNKDTPINQVFDRISEKYQQHGINREDGLKIDFEKDWVHLRTSNTEPIIRIYAESQFETTAANIANQIIRDIQESLA